MNSNTTNPFLHYNQQLNILFIKASKQKNPALWLFKNNVRSPLFMLEALTRLHKNTLKEPLFSKWNKRFKKLEDAFGMMDYLATTEILFKNNKVITKTTKSYFLANKTKQLVKLNKQLIEKEWLTKRLAKFNEIIAKQNLVYNDELLSKLKQSIIKEIQTIIVFCESKNYSFLLLETEVHELRRKLRWISMYAQALNGLIQLKNKPNTTKKYSTQYFTRTIIESPFNKLARKPLNVTPIELDKNSFLALSWIINELGVLKDKGLEIEGLSHALFKTQNITEYQAKEKALQILGLNAHQEKDILHKASEMTYNFIVKEKCLNTLVL